MLADQNRLRELRNQSNEIDADQEHQLNNNQQRIQELNQGIS